VRVALFGNVANNLFQLGQSLRERAPDIDAHLFVSDNEAWVSRPEADEPTLRDAAPSWIHVDDWAVGAALVAPHRARIVDALREFDLLIVSGNGPMFAAFTGQPYCFFVSGGDLTTTPFPLAFMGRYKTARQRVGALLIGPRQRRGIRRAREIWAPPYRPYLKALERLHLPTERLATEYFPVVIDTERFRLDAAAKRDPSPTARRLTDASDFVVFHPSRLMIGNRTARERESGNWKNNETLLRGFAFFARSGSARAPVLGLIDRTASPDVALAKSLIADLGIADQVRWLVGPRDGGFLRHELIELYSASDVVADDFGIGWFGGVTLEALAIERPVVQYIDEDVMTRLYPWHPIVSARTPQDVAEALERLFVDPDARRSLGARGREWIEEFHSYDAAAQRYASAIRRAAAAPRTSHELS
jgi:glycosyltransferase involved in cell wall biosynthesis